MSAAPSPLDMLAAALPALRASLRRRGIPTRDVDDLASTVLLAALEAMPRYAPDPAVGADAALRAWLAGITRHVVSHYKARAWVRSVVLVAPADLDARPDGAPDSEKLATLRERLALASSALEKLPTEVREAFVQHDVEGHALADVAARTGLPLRTVHGRVVRARAALAAAVRRTLAHDKRHAPALASRRLVRRARGAPPAQSGPHFGERLRAARGALATALRSVDLALEALGQGAGA